MCGILYLVATPIGNLEDITFRAVSVLKQVDLIASEDTRRSGILLSHYEISKPQQPYHDYNKERSAFSLIDKLKQGKNIALITDAGTPGIADPAFYIVRLAIANNIKIVSIPGPCAGVTGLVASGLPTDRFVFENFVPQKKTKRRKFLKSLENETRTLIMYESPYRILRLLEDIKEVYGNIHIVIGRELTKKFEEFLRGCVEELIEHFTVHSPKGEFVVLFNLKHQKP